MSTLTTTIGINNTERFKVLYHSLSRNRVSQNLLSTCYADNVVFCDPFHKIKGIRALTDYFIAMYSNVDYIDFIFNQNWHQNNCSMIRWTMNFRHPRLRKGELISIEGCSELRWEKDRIIYHRDFFDAGAMLYEHLPVFGWVISKLKERMQ